MKPAKSVYSGLVTLLSVLAGSAGAADKSDVRLIVQITVDGLRGDFLSRYDAVSVPMGFAD